MIWCGNLLAIAISNTLRIHWHLHVDVATHISPKFHILRLKYKCIRTSARNTRKQTAVDRGLRLDHHVTARVLAMALCLCLSVISRCSLEVVGRIEPVFGMEASFDQSYTVF